MKISNPNSKKYLLASKREASFWDGTGYVYWNTPEFVKIYEQKNRYQNTEMSDHKYFKWLWYFAKWLSIWSWLWTFELMLLKEWIVWHFTFLDISTKANQALEIKAKELWLSDRISTVISDLNFLNLNWQKYDFISCLNVLHHVVNIEECIYWLNQSLNDSGLIFLDECIWEQKMIWSPVKVDLVKSIRSYFKTNNNIDIWDFVVTNWKVITNNCPFECIRSHELNNIIKYYYDDTKVIHSEYGHIFHLWWHFKYEEIWDKYFEIFEQYDKFVKENKILQPNRLFWIYKKSDKPLLDSWEPWNDKEIKHYIWVSRINEKSLMNFTYKFLKNKYIYNICKRVYFNIRKFI